jgi:hypothetical protein
VSTNQLINTARLLADASQHAQLRALAPWPFKHQQQQLSGQPGTNQQQRQQQQQQQQQPKSAAAAAAAHASALVVGDAYYAAKQRLFHAEQVVLRLMRFELGSAQPHKHLLNLCRTLSGVQDGGSGGRAVAPGNSAAQQAPAAGQHTAGRHGAAAADGAALQDSVVCMALGVLNDALAYTTLACSTDPGVLAAAALQHALQLQLGQRGGGDVHDGGGLPHAPGQEQRQQQQGPRGSSSLSAGSSGSSMLAALAADGTWVAAAGLSQGDVARTQAVLQQLHAWLCAGCNEQQ